MMNRTLTRLIREAILSAELRSMGLLYHSTNFSNLLEILKSNILYGTSMYDYGVSTSRNKNYLFSVDEDGGIKMGEGECQLILNRDMLKNKYKIVPFDFEDYKQISNLNYHQSEDKILTSKINEIKKYIVGIQLNKNIQQNFKTLMNNQGDFIKNDKILIFDDKWNHIQTTI